MKFRQVLLFKKRNMSRQSKTSWKAITADLKRQYIRALPDLSFCNGAHPHQFFGSKNTGVMYNAPLNDKVAIMSNLAT